jgi:hypothetical protein
MPGIIVNNTAVLQLQMLVSHAVHMLTRHITSDHLFSCTCCCLAVSGMQQPATWWFLALHAGQATCMLAGCHWNIMKTIVTVIPDTAFTLSAHKGHNALRQLSCSPLHEADPVKCGRQLSMVLSGTVILAQRGTKKQH